MYGFHMGSISVYVLGEGYANATLWEMSGDLGPQWFTANVTLPPLFPEDQVGSHLLQKNGQLSND